MEDTSDPSNIISASKQIMYHGSTYGLLEYSIDGSMLRNCTLQIMYDMLSGCAFCFVVKKTLWTSHSRNRCLFIPVLRG